jgi:hypothetical protein
MTAAFMGFSGDTIADLEIQYPFAQTDHFTGPFMACDEWIMRWPGARQIAPDNFRIAAADRYRPDTAQNLKRTRLRVRYILYFKFPRLSQY